MPQHSSSASAYRRDAVAVGPFTDEPQDLMAILCELPDGSWRTGNEIRTGSREWLTGALNAAGVALRDYDQVVIGLLAEDGWSTVQVVAGWIARANGVAPNPPLIAGRRTTGRDPPGPSESEAATRRDTTTQISA